MYWRLWLAEWVESLTILLVDMSESGRVIFLGLKAMSTSKCTCREKGGGRRRDEERGGEGRGGGRRGVK